MDRLRPLAIPRQGHERPKACGVVVMMVRKKNRADLADVNTSLGKTPRDAVACINDIMCPVDGEEIGGLGSVGAQRRTSRRAERDQ